MVIFSDFLSIFLSYFKESTETKDFEEWGRNISFWNITIFKQNNAFEEIQFLKVGTVSFETCVL